MKKIFACWMFSLIGLFVFASPPTHNYSIKEKTVLKNFDLPETIAVATYASELNVYGAYQVGSFELMIKVREVNYNSVSELLDHPEVTAMKPKSLYLRDQVLHNSIYFRYWDKNYAYNNFVKPGKHNDLYRPKLC